MLSPSARHESNKNFSDKVISLIKISTFYDEKETTDNDISIAIAYTNDVRTISL